MTRDEALALASGQVVEVWLRGGWARAVVDRSALAYGGEDALVGLRRERRQPSGRRPYYIKKNRDVRLPPDPVPANVYADYLEENGFPEAAQALRKAFPLVT